MFKRLVTLLITFSIFTVSAHATSQTGLKAAFDELNYSLNVEWDQKDKAFYNTQMKTFQDTIAELQANGLTNAELVEFVKAEVKNEKIARDLETAFTMITIQKMSPAEASNYMMETMRKSYNQGASWNGSGVVVGVFVAVLLVAAAVATGMVVINGTKCGYSGTHCGVTCSGFDCDDKYCCWDK